MEGPGFDVCAAEAALNEVASRIKPLPDNVTPSEEFLRRMRLRLLKLEAKPSTSGRQASARAAGRNMAAFYRS